MFRAAKSLVRIVRWPAAVRAGALLIALLAIGGIVVGVLDPEGMAKRGSPVSIPEEACILGAAVLGVIRVRMFTWLSSLALAGFAIAALPSVLRADLVGGLWGIFWILLFSTPAVLTFTTEFKRYKSKTSVPPS
jgi:hypothetical protein